MTCPPGSAGYTCGSHSLSELRRPSAGLLQSPNRPQEVNRVPLGAGWLVKGVKVISRPQYYGKAVIHWSLISMYEAFLPGAARQLRESMEQSSPQASGTPVPGKGCLLDIGKPFRTHFSSHTLSVATGRALLMSSLSLHIVSQNLMELGPHQG